MQICRFELEGIAGDHSRVFIGRDVDQIKRAFDPFLSCQSSPRRVRETPKGEDSPVPEPDVPQKNLRPNAPVTH